MQVHAVGELVSSHSIIIIKAWFGCVRRTAKRENWTPGQDTSVISTKAEVSGFIFKQQLCLSKLSCKGAAVVWVHSACDTWRSTCIIISVLCLINLVINQQLSHVQSVSVSRGMRWKRVCTSTPETYSQTEVTCPSSIAAYCTHAHLTSVLQSCDWHVTSMWPLTSVWH